MSFDPTSVQVGDALPQLVVHVTRDAVVRYSGASTDLNPIHWDDESAVAIGLPSVVAHGMWTMGTALRVVTDWCEDPARVADYFVRFTRPLPVPRGADGAEVVFSGTVTAIGDGRAAVQLEATSGGDKLLGAAKVEVRL